MSAGVTLLVSVGAGVLAAPAATANDCARADTLSAELSVDEYGESVLCVLNRERADRGLAPLVFAKRLGVSSWFHARDMRDEGYFGHTSPDGRSFVDRIRAARYLEDHENDRWSLGETLAWSSEATSTPSRVVEALMDSPTHHDVVLDPRFREVGIGVVRGTPTPDDSGVTVAIDYGSLRSAAGLRGQLAS